MNLRSLDLNLLVVLDALLDEAHVTRAADRLAMSQSAASAALQRCRILFNDRLLERGRDVMHLTPFAEQLRVPLKAILGEVSALVASPITPLSQLRQTLRITMADYPALYVLPPLLHELQLSAPGIDIVVQPWRGNEAAREMLLTGSSDILISVFDDGRDDGLQCTKLLDEHYRVVMREGHPAAQNFDLKTWLEYPHIAVAGDGGRSTIIDSHLRRQGLSRRVGLVVPGFQMVTTLLSETDYLALLPSRAIPSRAGLTTFAPPLDIPGFPLHLAWHSRRERDTGLRHVVELITAHTR